MLGLPVLLCAAVLVSLIPLRVFVSAFAEIVFLITFVLVWLARHDHSVKQASDQSCSEAMLPARLL